MIDVGISDHQLIYCTRKIKRIKHNMHNQIQVQSLKKNNGEIFTNALKTVQFPNYNIFSNVNIAYSDLLNLQIDYNFYIEAKYNTQKLIKQ